MLIDIYRQDSNVDSTSSLREDPETEEKQGKELIIVVDYCF